MVTNATWYIPNHVLHTDLQIPTIKEEIMRLSSSYKAKIEVHPNKLTSNLFGTMTKADYAATRYTICQLDSTNLKVWNTESIHWNTSHHDIVSDCYIILNRHVLKV